MANEDDDKTTPFIRDSEGEPVVPAKPTATSVTPSKAKAKASTPAEVAEAAPVASDPGPYRSAGVNPPRKAGSHMFGNFEASKNRKMPRWAVPLITAVMFVEVGVFGGAWAKSIWEIEQLDRPKDTIDLAMAAPPPPPPPPPKGGAKPQTPQITPKKKTVKDMIQPVKIEKQEVQQPTEEAGDPDGEEGGVEGGQVGGVVGGDLNGVMGAPPQPQPKPPPPPAAPQIVAPMLLEGSRIAGNKDIKPDDVTKTEIGRSGKDKIVGSFKLCISTGGAVSSVSQIKSTTFPAYDKKITGEMRQWKYRPYMVNGKAVPVCTAVTFIYSQK